LQLFLVDAKRAFVDLGARYRSLSVDWKTAFAKNWAKAVVQATVFWSAVQRGEVAPLHDAKRKPPLLLIVTLRTLTGVLDTQRYTLA